MYKYTKEIRDFVNNPRIQYTLLRNKKLWSQLCCSLDVIEDADLAVDAYVTSELENDVGNQYLKIYGLLQALFLQQDAVKHLCESLDLPNDLKDYPELMMIRDIRNESIGHPTKKGDGKSYHSISRTSIRKSEFQLVSYRGENTKFRTVFVLDLIDIQRKYLTDVMRKLTAQLQDIDKAHRDKFKMEKLESMVSTASSYKIFEGINNPQRLFHSIATLNEIKHALHCLKEALVRRGVEIDTYESINYLYEKLEYPMAKLEAYFDRLKVGEGKKVDRETAYIFADFINHKFCELKELCREIDKEYSSEK